MDKLPLLALVVLLAGCVDTTPSETPDAASTTPDTPPSGTTLAPIPWIIQDCRELAVAFDADPAAVRPYLPEGFEPGPGLTPGRTLAGMDAFRCAHGEGIDGPLDDVPYASFWVVVTPPDEHKGNVTQWYFKWLVLVEDPASLELLQDAGTQGVHAGNVTYDAAPGAGTVATVELDGLGPITITTGPGAPGSASPATALREYMVTDDGTIVVWEGSLDRPTQTTGGGTLQVPAGSIIADVAGATTIPALVVDGSGGGIPDGRVWA